MEGGGGGKSGCGGGGYGAERGFPPRPFILAPGGSGFNYYFSGVLLKLAV